MIVIYVVVRSPLLEKDSRFVMLALRGTIMMRIKTALSVTVV